MAPPSTLPLWATNASTTTEPTLGKKQAGWVAAEKPPAKWLNWWMNLVYQWIVYYGEKDAANGIVGLGANTEAAWTATANNARGATITGHGTGDGVRGYGGASDGTGVRGVGGASNGIGVVGLGDGTGQGAYFTGGDSSGSGIVGVGGASNGIGILGYGDGTGQGVVGTGGDSDGIGVEGWGGTTNGIGVAGRGSGTGVGGYFDGAGNGTGASDDAIQSVQNIRLSGSNPAATTGFSNRLTPMNVPKAWAKVTTASSGGGGTLTSGFNMGSLARQGVGVHRFTFGTAMANADYALFLSNPTASGTTSYSLGITARTTTYFEVTIYSGASPGDVVYTFDVLVFGAQ